MDSTLPLLVIELQSRYIFSFHFFIFPDPIIIPVLCVCCLTALLFTFAIISCTCDAHGFPLLPLLWFELLSRCGFLSLSSISRILSQHMLTVHRLPIGLYFAYTHYWPLAVCMVLCSGLCLQLQYGLTLSSFISLHSGIHSHTMFVVWVIPKYRPGMLRYSSRLLRSHFTCSLVFSLFSL